MKLSIVVVSVGLSLAVFLTGCGGGGGGGGGGQEPTKAFIDHRFSDYAGVWVLTSVGFSAHDDFGNYETASDHELSPWSGTLDLMPDGTYTSTVTIRGATEHSFGSWGEYVNGDLWNVPGHPPVVDANITNLVTSRQLVGNIFYVATTYDHRINGVTVHARLSVRWVKSYDY